MKKLINTEKNTQSELNILTPLKVLLKAATEQARTCERLECIPVFKSIYISAMEI